jgi:hypothetical protein
MKNTMKWSSLRSATVFLRKNPRYPLRGLRTASGRDDKRKYPKTSAGSIRVCVKDEKRIHYKLLTLHSQQEELQAVRILRIKLNWNQNRLTGLNLEDYDDHCVSAGN